MIRLFKWFNIFIALGLLVDDNQAFRLPGVRHYPILSNFFVHAWSKVQLSNLHSVSNLENHRRPTVESPRNYTGCTVILSRQAVSHKGLWDQTITRLIMMLTKKACITGEADGGVPLSYLTLLVEEGLYFLDSSELFHLPLQKLLVLLSFPHNLFFSWGN